MDIFLKVRTDLKISFQKVKFYSDLNLYIQKVKKSFKNTIVMGDFNVAPSPNDIGLGEVNAKRWLEMENVLSFLKLKCGNLFFNLDILIHGGISIPNR